MPRAPGGRGQVFLAIVLCAAFLHDHAHAVPSLHLPASLSVSDGDNTECDLRVCFVEGPAPLPRVDVLLVTAAQPALTLKVLSNVPTTGCTAYNESGRVTLGSYNLVLTAPGNATAVMAHDDNLNLVGGNDTAYVTLWWSTVENKAVVSYEGGSVVAVINQAFVRLVTFLQPPVQNTVYAWHRNTNCHRCNASALVTLDSDAAISDYVMLQTDFPEELSFSLCDRMAADCPDLGNQTYHLGERGFYTLLATGSPDKPIFTVVRDVRGVADHGPDTMPVLYTFLVLAVAFGGYHSLCYFCGSQKTSASKRQTKLLVNESGIASSAEATPLLGDGEQRAPMASPAEKGDADAPATAKPTIHGIGNPRESRTRLQSLDSFRGFALTIMIFVNFNGGMYYFFNHSIWNGLTVADLVFPWFVWIMGTSMAIAFNSLLKRRTPRGTMLYKVVRRACILFLLGLGLSNLHDLRNGRIPNVLQRFSISYLVVGLVMLYVPKMPAWWVGGSSATDTAAAPPPLAHGHLNPRLHETTMLKRGRPLMGALSAVVPYFFEWMVILACAVLWLILTFCLPVPGCPTGYIGPGGALAEFGRFAPPDGQPCAGDTFCCEGGAAGYIDRWVLSWRHIYPEPTSQVVYQTGAYDPEGILGTLNSIVICYLGLQAGKIIVHFPDNATRTRHWLTWSLICGVIATALCGASRNDGVIPVSKNLWSLSFVLLMSCFAFFLLTVFYWVIDVWRMWAGAPFRYVGMNSIFIYIFHESFSEIFPLSWSWMDGEDNHAREMFMNVFAVSLLCLLCYYCFSINFFVKV